MKKVSIFLFLLTVTLTTINENEFKNFVLMIFTFGLSYLFGFYVIGKFHHYHRRKRLENEFAEIFNDDFLLRLKREVAILKIKNELKEISSSELCTDQTDKDTLQ